MESMCGHAPSLLQHPLPAAAPVLGASCAHYLVHCVPVLDIISLHSFKGLVLTRIT